MKKILASILITTSALTFADTGMNMDMMGMGNSAPTPGETNIAKSMYFDFGLGVGSASGLSSSANTAINAMTMGAYFSNNLGVEVGMDTLPNGSNSNGQAMIMTYHLAAKGVLPLSQVFNLYAKGGLGINQYQAQIMNNDMNVMGMQMINQTSFGLYYAGGMQFNFNRNFAIYLEGSGVAVPGIGNNGNAAMGSLGSTYMGTLGLEIRI